MLLQRNEVYPIRLSLLHRIIQWMHPAMIREIEEAVKSVGVDYMTMPSGAGHDAMHWADVVPTGMIFIPCREGISHNPSEFTDMDDIVTGAKVLDYGT